MSEIYACNTYPLSRWQPVMVWETDGKHVVSEPTEGVTIDHTTSKIKKNYQL